MSEKITFEQLQEKGSQIPKTNIDQKPNGPVYREPGKIVRSRFRLSKQENSGFPLDTYDSFTGKKTGSGDPNYRINQAKHNDAVSAERELKEAGILPPFDGDRTGLDYNPSSKVVQQKMTELRSDLHQYQTQQTLENVTNISPFVIGAAGAAVIYNKFIKPKKK